MGAQEPHGEQPGHTRQRRESGKQWPCGEQWRWTGCGNSGKPQRKRRTSWRRGDPAQSMPLMEEGGDEKGSRARRAKSPQKATMRGERRDGVAPAQGVSILGPSVVRQVAQDIREQPRLSVCIRIRDGKQRSCGRDSAGV
eukprot:1385062-Pleurochrysis_carterae.AAC.4